jgi:NTE family protein/lysophospholipid hydrolase
MSLITGRKFERLAQQLFGETLIEDLWVNYFCVSANITTTETVVHKSGPIWQALRATASLPGIAVPFIQGRNLLVDGGVLNNLPVDVMFEMCNGFVIAVNVSPERDLTVDFSQFPSPWKVLWDRLVAASRARNVPNILDMLLRTTMVGSIHQTNAVKQAADLYLQPPLNQFKLFDFRAIDAIAQAGYTYAKSQLAGWQPHYR